jgi:acyl carrier protein
MNVKDALRDYVARSFLNDGQTPALADDTDLMELLDSLQVLRMVADLEKRFSIHVGNDDLTADNFGSVEKLAGFIGRKRQGPNDSGAEAFSQSDSDGAHR